MLGKDLTDCMQSLIWRDPLWVELGSFTMNPRTQDSMSPFHIYCAHQVGNVVFIVKYDNSIGAMVVGRAYVPVKDLLDFRAVA